MLWTRGAGCRCRGGRERAVGSGRSWACRYLAGATVGAGRARRRPLPSAFAEAEGDVGACTWREPAALALRRGRCHGDSLSCS